MTGSSNMETVQARARGASSARLRRVGVMLAALAVAMPVMASAADTAEDAAIAAPARALEKAWNAGDGKAWGDAFWPDADSVNIYGGTLHGGAAMGARHAVVFAGRLKGTHMRSDIVDVRHVGRDAGIVQTVQIVDPPAGTAESMPGIKVFVTMVVERRNGVWKVAHVQNTTVTRSPAE